MEQERAFGAGGEILRGNFSRENLKVIVDWKIEARYVARVSSYLDQNSDAQIAKALRIATTSVDERAAIEALDDLYGAPVHDVLDAAREAGRQLGRDGAIRSETLKTVSRELLPLDAYLGHLNQLFEQTLRSAGASGD